MAPRSIWKTLARVGLDLLSRRAPDGPGRSRRAGTGTAGPAPRATPVAAARRAPAATGAAGQYGDTATIEVDPAAARPRIQYAPDRDGEPDAGEIVWTWVPYAERDGRGKDRPVLVIARHTAERVYAVKLTSQQHSARDDRLGIGAGPWDASGRESWVDTDQLYSVHRDGLRREAAALDIDRFTRVAAALQQRFGWRVG